jgi:hypothetical protein
MRQGTRNTPVGFEEMIAEKEIIKKVHKVFKQEYKILAIKKRGYLSTQQVDKLMNKAIEKVTMTKEQEEIVQGFYDTYMGMLVQGGSDFAEMFAKTVVGEEE